MSETRKCYSYVRCGMHPKECTTKCEFHEDGLACPFRTPRGLWELDLCDECAHDKTTCAFTEKVVVNRRSGNVVGCFGFVEKEEKE